MSKIMKVKYFLFLIVFLFALLLLRVATVQTEKTGINKLRDIVPKRIKAKILFVRSKLLNGSISSVDSFSIDGVEHNFYKYYISEENKEVSENKPTGYLQQFEDKIIFVTGRGLFYVIDLKQFDEKKILPIPINNNFVKDEKILARGAIGIRDLKIKDDYIYVSYQKKISENCYNLAIDRSVFNLEKLNFKNFFSFKECSRKKEGAWAVLSGGRLAFKGNYIYYSIGEMALRDISQDDDSYFGKIIKININNSKEVKIAAKGLRNSQGLFYDDIKDIILITDHAELGGDEINVIKNINEVPNFGWPVASYGDPYSGNNNFLKSHKLNGFKEPFYYFKEKRVGVSQIIGYNMDKNKARYLVTSMRGKSIFFFDLINDEKLEINKRIILKERIRDIIKIDDKKMYIMVLETSPAIGVIKY